MPTYDYRCNACSHTFEHMQSMKDKALKKCPKCGKTALERLIGTGAAVIFKGGGFYQTDYRSESYKKAAEAESKPAVSETTSEPKGESKSDTKGDAKSGGETPSPGKKDSPTSPPAPSGPSSPASSSKAGDARQRDSSSTSRVGDTSQDKSKPRARTRD